MLALLDCTGLYAVQPILCAARCTGHAAVAQAAQAAPCLAQVRTRTRGGVAWFRIAFFDLVVRMDLVLQSPAPFASVVHDA